MAQPLQILKCPVCDTVIEVLDDRGQKDTAASEPWGLELVCCGRPMKRLNERTSELDRGQHVPVIEPGPKGVRVRVGACQHPMSEAHHIEWIEIVADGRSQRQFLMPGERPEAFFEVTARSIRARAYCNLHGLWKNDGADQDRADEFREPVLAN